MRVLNEELRKKIIDEATKEFYQVGYQKSSLRNIVKSAGTTIGNFYNYFKSKEELYYTITDPIYNYLTYYMRNHSEDEVLKNIELDFAVIREYIKSFIKQISHFEIPFVILLSSSEGTKYDKVWDLIVDVFSEHFKEHYVESPLHKKMEIDTVTSNSIAHGFLSGLLYILKSSLTLDEKIENLTDLCMIYFIGMFNIV